MKRPITGFHTDEQGDWVAELSCGHRRHVRHDPPWHERPWVADPSGRARRLGEELDCPRCDRREIPEDFASTRRTPRFDADTIPKGLLRRHTTRAGTWARIHVLHGRLRYRIHAPYHEEQMLSPERPGVVLPEVEHDVSPVGDVAFHVEFFARPTADPRRR